MLKKILVLAVAAVALPLGATGLRIGIVGCDTSHVPVFVETFNNPQGKDYVPGGQVVAAFKGGSPDFPQSASRVEGFARTLQEKYGIKFYATIPELCRNVDVVLLESVDGRAHLEQARAVIAARKPLFIDKPMAASLADVVEIFRLARLANDPVWSASSLRFGKDTQTVRAGKIGVVSHAETYSPCELAAHHPELFWYGIHGVESLYTVMGLGCESVRRTVSTNGALEVVGTWRGGREGVYHQDLDKKYHGLAVGALGEAPVGSYDGYVPLTHELMKFFQTGQPPVKPEETIELFAFMTAAQLSKDRRGAPVRLDEVMSKLTLSMKD